MPVTMELSPSLVLWTLTMTVVAVAAAVIGKVGLGMLRAYYILRVRAGLPVVLWFPKFWRIDGRRQRGSSLSKVLKRMDELDGPHGMYGTVFGTQAVLHVADPEAAALVLSQHSKGTGYDHFGGFFGRGVFTAGGEEWRKKRTSVAHAMFRGGRREGGGSKRGTGDANNGGKSLAMLANQEADSIVEEVEALREEEGGEEVEVEMVRLLQRHTLNLIHRFLCGGSDVLSSDARRRLLPRYLDAVTDMRMIILARSRSVWMFAWGWVYRAFSPFQKQETKNMIPIREFAELVLQDSICQDLADDGNSRQVRAAIDASGNKERNGSAVSTERGGGTTAAGITPHDASRRSGKDDMGRNTHLPEGCAVAAIGECRARAMSGDRNSAKTAPFAGHSRANQALKLSTPDEEAGVEVEGSAIGDERGVAKTPGPATNHSAPGVRFERTESTEEKRKQGSKRTRTVLCDLAERKSHQAYPNSMVDETITLLFAGQDTSAATLSWTMHLLSLPENRPYLLEVRREVKAAVGSSGGVGVPAEKRLPMVDACIRESQRLYPVAPFVVRQLTSDLRLKDGTLLPAGAQACIWIYGLHRHPNLWKSPDEFLPRRWLDGERQPAGAFIPYASGPRGCVGRPFAGVAIRILLARICLALNFSPASLPVPLPDATMESPVPGPSVVTDQRVPVVSRVRIHRRESVTTSKVAIRDSRDDTQKSLVEGEGRNIPKEMQAGFTVLPAGGVHLRLVKWER